jgi:hypothetical protein
MRLDRDRQVSAADVGLQAERVLQALKDLRIAG